MTTSRTVGIVDYGAGNIQSIENALAHIGAKTRRVAHSRDLPGCTHVILPGVGAFGFCGNRLRGSGLAPALEQWACAEKKPLLGICVGMQLLADGSEESPEVPGLGWIGGPVRALSPATDVRVPHVGWNQVEFQSEYGAFPAGSSADFYFDHSFAFGEPRSGVLLGRCLHGASFSAVVRHENITAAQFHPEKSQSAGLKFLRGFLLQ